MRVVTSVSSDWAVLVRAMTSSPHIPAAGGYGAVAANRDPSRTAPESPSECE